MKDNRHCVLYGNCIYFFEGMFDIGYGDFEFVFRIFIEGMYVVALAPAMVMTIIGSTFELLFMRLSISRWYFFYFCGNDFG